MIITEIKKDKKHLTRITFCNGEEILLDTDTCTENSLVKGMDLNEEKVAELNFDSEYKRAKSRALWYLDRMDHTEKDLYTKLTRAGFDRKASAKVLERLCELGVVDDRRFAERFAERCAQSNVSKVETMHKMLQKGVPYDLAKEILSDMETDEDAQIKALIEKKYYYKLSREGGAQKVYAALVRKGFSYGAVSKALKEYISEICEEC